MNNHLIAGMDFLMGLVLEPTVEVLLEKITQGLPPILKIDACGIGILSENQTILLHYHLNGLVDPKLQKSLQPNQALVKKIILEKENVYLNALTDEEKNYFGLPTNCTVNEFSIIPLILKSKIIGFVYFIKSASDPSFQKELTNFKKLGNTISTLYENVSRYEPLKRNENLFQEFSNNIPLVFWKATLDLHTFIYINPTYKKIWGLATQEIYEKPFKWADFITEKDRKRVIDTFLSISEKNPYISVEYTISRPDGELRYIHDTAFLMKDTKGNPISIVGVATDITEKKKIDKNLHIQSWVTKILSEAHNLEIALPQILQLICENLDWELSGFWILDNKTKKLQYVLIWPKKDEKHEEFESSLQQVTFKPGIGLPGQVLITKKPAWIEDVQTDPSFTRVKAAKKLNLHGAYAAPIVSNNMVFGVIEFFSKEKLNLDRDLINLLENTGKQLGQFTRRKQSEEQLDHMASHDVLTGLANRRLLTQKINESIVNASNEKRNVAILFLDLDRFKHINDTFGHEIGDNFLKTAAKRLSSQVRKKDIVARLGGDEFVIVLPSLKNKDDVSIVAQKVLDNLSKPFIIKGHQFYITTSLGISIFPQDGKDSRTLLTQADIAMYQAKYLGGNNYQFCTSELTKTAKEKGTLEMSLYRALEKKEFVLLYQPKLSFVSKKIIGVEALLHWNTNGVMVGPKKFLGLAEETGLIIPIGEWVLKKACSQAKEWHKMGLPLMMSVNLSTRQFLQTNLINYIKEVLDEVKLDPNFLEIEITESMIMKNTEIGMEVVRNLKEMQLQIALDDFGTGYSSLMYLKRFKVDRLKIDQSFVEHIPEDRNDEVIARTIIGLGHSLGLKVVAEGVETKAQLDFMKRYHCDEVQGYYIAHPLPEREVTDFLMNYKSEGDSDHAS